MRYIKSIIIVFIFIICLVIVFFFRGKKEIGIPSIILKGNRFVTINTGEKYEEDGFRASDSIDGDITKNVVIINNTDYTSEGVYPIIYKVKNSYGIVAENRRYIKVLSKPYYKDEYDKIDNTVRGWWANNNKDKKRPLGGASVNELKKYNAYYMGSDEKVIYLTFDEGSLETYIEQIVDVLNKNNVKATFFLCYKYMISNKELIKKMVSNGHLIGNHTVNHKSMPSLATRNHFDEYLSEIKMVEDGFYDITGERMKKVYRDPKGEWSYRDLQIMKDLGYKSYFYSSYYMDFGEDVSKAYALNELMKRYHNGAIYLLHPKNKGNYLALDSFIKELKKLGYKFDTIDNIS
ncbi:MAG: polysaccharide deacetylase family protein [Bacilli bacterium]|nr:polysaccharide deacetylase family protein [Bacilli bacterium]